VKRKDVEIWQKICGDLSRQKPWELKSAEDYINNGNKYKEEGDMNAAMMEYMEGISRFPDNDTLFYCLGNLYKETGEHIKAKSAYKKALAINPRHLKALYAIEELNL